MLRTNADVTSLQAVLRYVELLQVEKLFCKQDGIDTRPIFHSSDAAIRGHVFCTFLATLLLQKCVGHLARAAGNKREWMTLLRKLDRLREARMGYGEKDWLIRTDATPADAAARATDVSAKTATAAPGQTTEPTTRSPKA